MHNSEDEAKKLIGEDRSSWSGRGRARKAYRSMPLTPDEEVPPHRSPRKNKKKHVHKWGEWEFVGKEVKVWWWTRKRETITVYKWVRVCKKCGYRDKAQSTTDKPTQFMRRWYW